MLTISSGHSASYLTDAVTTGRENYYTGAVAAGEPAGRWYGAGAAKLGLVGLVDHQDMTAVFERFLDPRDPNFANPEAWDEAATLGHTGRRYTTAEQIWSQLLAGEPDASPERVEELRIEAGKRARSNVSFLDATFSVQKSVTVLHAAFEAQQVAAEQAGEQEAADAWGVHVEAVESAIWAGNQAGLDYLAAKAGYSRVGHHGGNAGRFVDAHEWTIASFFQHDNRDHDPQLHIHNAILNRVQDPEDGVWRTLDGSAVYTFRAAAAAVAERTMEEHLTRSMGVRFATRPDGKSREILGIRDEVRDLFSTRRRAITGKTKKLVETFTEEFGRSPNALELDRLQRQATLATRSAKSHDGETSRERLRRWNTQLQAVVSGGLAEVAADVLDLAGQAPEPGRFSPTAVKQMALAQVQDTKAAWTEPDLARAVSDALPDYLGGLDGTQVARLVDGLTAEAIAEGGIRLTADGPAQESLPKDLTLADGRSAYDRPGGIGYATEQHLAGERALQAAGAERDAAAVDPDAVQTFLGQLRAEGVELGADQAAAVTGVLTSRARVEALVGPAGTGKSFVLGALARAWTNPTAWEESDSGNQTAAEEDHRRPKVIGLASSQIATDVLAGEGLASVNISRWFATQTRLDEGRARGDDPDWRLNPGDLLVVDESAMTDTPALTAIHQRCQAAGAKLLLCGDHRQLAAVGAAGGMALVADTGPTYELAEARRFDQEWERDASLRLREGDQDALIDYRKHGRLIDAGTLEDTETAAIRGYLADTVSGLDTLLVTDSNEHAAAVSAKVRAELVRLGRVAEDGIPLGLDGTIAGVGDLVQARANDWTLAGYQQNRRGPINRETYRVEQVHDDGSLTVTTLHDDADRRVGEHITLPASYVAENLALGYASTAYAAQGQTVDTCHTLAGPATSPPSLYVGMSRGRACNTAYVTTLETPDETAPGPTRQVERKDPVALLSAGFDTHRAEQAALAEATDSEDEATTIRPPGERFADIAMLAVAGRTTVLLDRLTDAGALTDGQRRAITGSADGVANLDRILRQAEIAGHDPQQVLRTAIEARPLSGAREPAHVIHHRITATVPLDPQGDTYADWTPHVDDPAWRQHLDELAALADHRTTELAANAVDDPPPWAVAEFGPVPTDPKQRGEWRRRAGIVAAHRELAGHDDPDTALPGPPKPGQVEAYASWRAAWRALDRPDAGREEAELSDAQLRVRVRAHEREKTWAPAYVAPELSGTTQAQHRHHQAAELHRAEADTAADEQEQARLHQQTADAETLAADMAARREQLQKADRARGLWYAHTAATRTTADRARAELSARGLDPDTPTESTTGCDWIAAHSEQAARDDQDREVTGEHELVDVAGQRDRDTAVFDDTRSRTADADQPGPAPAQEDVRETTAGQAPPDSTHDWDRVPDVHKSEDALARARRALDELHTRQTLDAQREADRAAEAGAQPQLAPGREAEQSAAGSEVVA